MFTKIKTVVTAAFALLALAGAASAQEAKPGPLDLSVNVGVASDYVFRGVSQTDEGVQVSGGADATFGGIAYAGAWVSNVDFGNGTDLEYDLYAGVRPTAGSVTFDFGVLRYGYVDAPAGPDQDFWEVKAAASAPIGPATLGASINYSPEFFGETGSATYVELNGAAPLSGGKLILSGAVGRQSVEDGVDYTTWNVGVGYAVTDKVTLDVRYWDTTDHDALGGLGGSRLTAGLKAVF